MLGNVSFGEGSSVWSLAAIRAEVHAVSIGSFSNVQDFVMLHAEYRQGVAIGDYCSMAHRATLHGCVDGNACLVGIGATIMDGCIWTWNDRVGHSSLPEGTVVPPNSIVMGTHAEEIRSRNSSAANVTNALLYHLNSLAYARGEHGAWTEVSGDGVGEEAEAIAAAIASG